MTIKSFTIFLLLLLNLPTYAQVMDSITFKSKSIKQNKTAFLTLGSFALANVTYSGIAWANAERSSIDYSFHATNTIWNAINIGIVAPSYCINPFRKSTTAKDIVTTHRNLEKTLLINAGFDVGYILVGTWMLYEAQYKGDKRASWEGSGKAIVYNGLALFLYDMIFYAFKNKLSNTYLHPRIQFSTYPMPATSSWCVQFRYTW
ncbi:MAG: hypothetical protein MUE33_00915 [Cytophagaceae bacterium]|nr:hypothetical protein [Cytophagaceae bacterium]